MIKINGEILQPIQKKPVKLTYIWLMISALFFVSGFLISLIQISPESISLIQPFIWICIEMLCVIVFFHKNWFWCLWIPIVLICIIYTPMGLMHSVLAMIDYSIMCFNTINHTAFHITNTLYTVHNLTGTLSLLTCLATILYANAMRKDAKKMLYCLIFVLILWMLLIQVFSSIACTCLLVSVWIPVFLNADFSLPISRHIGMCIFAASLLMSGIVYGNVDALTVLREKVKQNVHDVRYGKDVLPLGSLNNADLLYQDNGEILTVSSQQAKNLYLKAFTGSVYEDGQWEKEADSVYEMDNEGLQEWLKQHNFDPLYQVAQYNALSDENTFEENTITIHVENASREIAYAPTSVSSFQNIKVKEDYDQTIYSHNFIPKRTYTETELSGSNPSEIMTVDAWIEAPKTAAQKEYVEAESAYRSFVYDTYTKVNASVYSLIEDVFWKDYQTDSDSIYSSVTHIRDCLKAITYNGKNSESDADPLVLFLKGEMPSNQLVLTTCAVEAMRAHGIPARYVEGYYVSSTSLSHADQVSLVAENAHVWMEVYFDGIGWLPIDVIPGYYKDSVSLRNMVGQPDAVHKSAMLEKDKNNAGEYDDSTKNGGNDSSDVLSKISTIGKQILGMIAIVFLSITGLICIFEVLRWLALKSSRRKFDELSYFHQAKLIHRILIYMLSLRGITTVVGWHTEETDALISSKYANIQPGDYEKICALLEKVLYGNQQLEEYEHRTIQIMLDTIFESEEEMTILTKCKKHMTPFYCLKIILQLSNENKMVKQNPSGV